MNNIIKFPKEKTQLINRVLDAIEISDYKLIISMKDQLLDNIEDLKDSIVFDCLLDSLYNLYLFEEIIIVGDELLKKGYESFDLYYYMLLSYIALVDIYQAKSLIRKSKLLNNKDIQHYYTNEGANYSNILGMDNDLFTESALSLLIVNYINEVSKEMAGDIEIDRQYLLYRFFDLINMVYELGYDDYIIMALEKALKIIFEIEM